MKKKQKILIGTVTPILGVSAIVTPLAVVLSRQTTSKISNIEQWADKTFDVTKKSYQRLMRDFLDKFETEYLPTVGEDEDKIALEKTHFADAINTFERKAAEGKNGYTTLTSAVIDYAQKNYDVKLARQTNITDTDIQVAWQSCRQASLSYMISHGITDPSEQEALLNDAETKWNESKGHLANIYDPLNKYQKALEAMIVCFDQISDETAKLSAAKKLNDFESRYTFETKDGDNTRFDALKAIWTDDKKGETISTTQMLDYFEITDTEEDSPIDEPDEFENMIPGYKLEPKFAGFSENPKANEYSMLVDWTAYSPQSPVLTSNNVNDRVAHKYFWPRKTDSTESDARLFDTIDYDEGHLSEFPLQEHVDDCAPKYDTNTVWRASNPELKALKETYNPGESTNNKENDQGRITWKWADDEDCAWEHIFAGKPQPDPYGHDIYNLDASGLGSVGIMISDDGENYERVDLAGVRAGNWVVDHSIERGTPETREEETPLLYDFLNNVDFYGEATVLTDTETGREAKIHLYAKYKNSKNNEAVIDLGETITPPKIKVSTIFFDESCIVYKQEKDFFTTYTNNEFKQLYELSIGWVLGLSTIIAVNSAYVIYCVGSLLIPSVPPSNKIRCGIGLLVGGGAVASAAVALRYWTHDYRKKLKEFSNSCNDFNKETPVKNILGIFDEDKATYDVPFKKKYIIDHSSQMFMDKYNAFAKIPAKKSIEKLKKYRTIGTSEDAQAFYNLIKSGAKYENLNPKKYKEFDEPWEGMGKRNVVHYVCFTVSLVCTAVAVQLFTADMKKYKQIKLQKKKDTLGPISDRDAQLDEYFAKKFEGDIEDTVNEQVEDGMGKVEEAFEDPLDPTTTSFRKKKAELYIKLTNEQKYGGFPRRGPRGELITIYKSTQGGFNANHATLDAAKKFVTDVVTLGGNPGATPTMKEIVNYLNLMDFSDVQDDIIKMELEILEELELLSS